MDTIISDKWNIYLDCFKDSEKDIYYTEDYVKLYETKDCKALCAVCSENGKVLMMPYLRKEIDGYYDFETAYGYGGPISNTDDTAWNDKALDEMESLFKREKYVCGFIRFHTLLNNADMCKKHMHVLFDRNTVVINTEQSDEDIWASQFTSQNRNKIRKAERNELVYKAEYDFASLPQFVKLYNATMKRLAADEFYYFDDKYYQSFVDNLRGRAFLGTVRKNEEIICASLFMFSTDYGHYHLEGSNHEYSNLAANNLLLWKTACEFHRLGVKEFHLGGGYDSNSDNSLLVFKKSFSSVLKNYYIGKWIFNREAYEQEKNEWAAKNPDKIEKYGKYLLCYRY